MESYCKEKKNVLSIGLLVSNRRDSILKCLESLRPVRDAISSELIILDTGCDADVRTILDQYGDEVSDFVWCNDFSKARNACLSRAKGEWFLYLDDDEWFVSTEELIDFFSSGAYQNYGSASYIQRNFLDMEATQYTDSWVGRMARITPELHFESKIHEYLTPLKGAHRNLRAIVHHFGYVYTTEEAKRAHFERNRTLLEEMITTEPYRLRWRVQLLLEYRTMEDYAMLEKLGRENLALLDRAAFRNEAEVAAYTGTFYAAIILADLGKGMYAEVLQTCLAAMVDARNTTLFQAFASAGIARAAFYLGLEKSAQGSAGQSEEYYKKSQEYGKRYLEHLAYFEKNQEILYRMQAAPFVGECFDEVKKKEVYSILICAGLKLHSTEALQKYMDALRWDEENVYVFEEMADTLIEAMNSFSVWKEETNSESGNAHVQSGQAFAKLLRIMHCHGALWQYFCGKIQCWEQEGHDMHPIVELIGQLLPEAVHREQEDSQAISPEMQQLAVQVKEQLRLLIANGMMEQAKEIIGQVRRMLPEDAELIALEADLLG